MNARHRASAPHASGLTADGMGIGSCGVMQITREAYAPKSQQSRHCPLMVQPMERVPGSRGMP